MFFVWKRIAFMSFCKAFGWFCFFWKNKNTLLSCPKLSWIVQKISHFYFPLQYWHFKPCSSREYLQTAGNSALLSHSRRLGWPRQAARVAAGVAAAAALRGKRSSRTSSSCGCRTRETVHLRSDPVGIIFTDAVTLRNRNTDGDAVHVLHWRGPTKNWADCDERDRRRRKDCLDSVPLFFLFL